MSNSVRPHGQQPTRLLCPRDSPGKNTRLPYFFVWCPPYSWSHRLKTIEIFLVVSSQICSHLPFLLYFLLSILCMLLPGQACSVTDWPRHPLPHFPDFPMFLQTCLCLLTFWFLINTHTHPSRENAYEPHSCSCPSWILEWSSSSQLGIWLFPLVPLTASL